MSSLFLPIRTADLEWRNDLPFSRLYDDIYYSAESGIKQSRHVFIDGNNLIKRWGALPVDKESSFTIGETGFGTGLNFLYTWKLWEENAPKSASLHYISCDKHPLKINDLKRCLDNWPELSNYTKQLIEHYPVLTPGYHHLSFSSGRITLTLMLGDAFECYEQLLICGDSKLEVALRSCFVDAWYLDGFSPIKNQGMWSDSLFTVIAMLSSTNATLATYTAAGLVKNALTNVGFIVEKKKGFGLKRHMITAYYRNQVQLRTKVRNTPWMSSPLSAVKNKSALIVGAGLAGCFAAHSLAKRGWKVTLIDELDQVGCYGSANQQAVIFPKLSAYKSPLTQFMLSAFLYSVQTYKSILNQYSIGEIKGSLLMAYNEKEKKTQESLRSWLSNYPELGLLVNFKEASELSGLDLNQSGLFIPLSGWINSPALCKILIDNENISLCTNMHVNSLQFDGENWIIHDNVGSVLILANGNKAHCFKETEYMPIKTIHGQMSAISSTQSSSKLRVPVSAEGHVLPAINGVHRFGASYELGRSTLELNSQADIENYSKLMNISHESVWSKQIIDQWAGIRASTPDYLPLVGQIVRANEFITAYSGLGSNSKRWIAKSGPYYPGLYVCAGFGSRGLTTIPLSAEWLASLINKEMSCLPRNMIQAISPSRFLRKNISRGLS